MIYKIKQIIDMFFAQRQLYKRATTENNWVECHKCIYRNECETREMRYGCSMGDEE